MIWIREVVYSMLDQLESNYECSNAGTDLHELKEELEQLTATSGDNPSPEVTERINRIENQIHFIKNKCDIH